MRALKPSYFKPTLGSTLVDQKKTQWNICIDVAKKGLPMNTPPCLLRQSQETLLSLLPSSNTELIQSFGGAMAVVGIWRVGDKGTQRRSRIQDQWGSIWTQFAQTLRHHLCTTCVHPWMRRLIQHHAYVDVDVQAIEE